MSWYGRVVRDVRELRPSAALALQWTFESIEHDATADPDSPRWRTAVNTIAGVLRGSTEQRLSRPYRRLEAFVTENQDLLEVDLQRTA